MKILVVLEPGTLDTKILECREGEERCRKVVDAIMTALFPFLEPKIIDSER